VYDSRRWRDVARGVHVLQAWRHVDLADVNWRRLAPVRRALVVAAAGHEEGWTPSAIRIAHCRGDHARAWLLAGWLASRLGWPSDAAPQIEELPEDETVLSVAVGAGDNIVQLSCDGRRVLVAHPGGPPSTIGIPVEGDAEAVSAELHMLSRDISLHDALAALQRMLT